MLEMVGDRRRSAPAKHGEEGSPPSKKRRPTSFGGVVRDRHVIESSDDDCEKAEAVKIAEDGKEKRTPPPTSTSGQSSASRKGCLYLYRVA